MILRNQKPSKLRRVHRAIVTINVLVCLLAGTVMLQRNIIQVAAQVLPVTVSTHELMFGAVFPGETLSRSFVVGFDGEEIVEYRILQRPKPLPENHPEYPDGGDPDNPGFYRDLCPYLTKVSYDEGEDDVEGPDGAASVSLIDLTDTWQVEFEVPAIVGHIAQDHTGGFVSINGEYGCDIVIDVAGEETVFTSTELGNNTLFASDVGSGVGGIKVLGESAEPNLVIGKLHTTAGPINPGDTGITFEIIVTNNGNLMAFDAMLYDQLPEGFTYTDSGLNTRSWPLGDIAPGEIKHITYSAQADESIEPGEYINTVSASAANHGPINATAKTYVENVSVLGISQEVLEETGMSEVELIWLLILLTVLFSAERGVKYLLVRQEKKKSVKL